MVRRQLSQRVEVLQRLQHARRRRTEVEQAGDLVDTDRFEPLHQREARLRCADQSTRRRESLVQKVDELRLVVGRERGEIHRLPSALGQTREQSDVLTDVRTEGRPRFFPDRALVCSHERVDHDRHLSRRRIEAGCGTGRAIPHDLAGERVDILIEQVREQVRARRSGAFKRLGLRRCGDPDRTLGLYGAR